MPITQRVRAALGASSHTRPMPNSFRLRLARGGLLLLPEKVDGGVAVTLMMREESWGKGVIEGQRSRSRERGDVRRAMGTLKPPPESRVENPSRPRMKCLRRGRRHARGEPAERSEPFACAPRRCRVSV